jgi:PST family polysaccharide transporter
VQGASYILPLITVPYLVRVIGPEKFGLLGFAAATTAYFGILITFGFRLSAPKQLVVVKHDEKAISQIFSAVITSQLLFALVSFIILSGLLLVFQKFQVNWIIYYLTFGVIVADILLPSWFFHGMEKMKFIAFLSIFSKLLYTLGIFIFVKTEDDFYLVPIFNLIGTLVSGLAAFWIIYFSFKIKFRLPSLAHIVFQINQSKHVFLSSAVGSSYTISITFFLGLITNNTIVGYFSAADKIIKAIQGLFKPIITTLYPHINKLLDNNVKTAISFLKITMWILAGISLLTSLLILVFSKEITLIILGENFIQSAIFLKVMAPVPFFVTMGSVFAILTMLSFDRSKDLSKIYMKTAAVSLIATTILIYTLNGTGAAFSVLFAEVVATSLMVRYITKSNIGLLNRGNF